MRIAVATMHENHCCQKRRCCGSPVQPAKPAAATSEVTEVINKRGRRCEYEYECRWSNRCADETTWESTYGLVSDVARRAVQAFEGRLKSSSRAKLLMGQLICERCNSVIEKANSLYPRYMCKDTAYCERAVLSQTTRTRRSCRTR